MLFSLAPTTVVYMSKLRIYLSTVVSTQKRTQQSPNKTPQCSPIFYSFLAYFMPILLLLYLLIRAVFNIDVVSNILTYYTMVNVLIDCDSFFCVVVTSFFSLCCLRLARGGHPKQPEP